jgi:diguanylate cyclase (GGDEF)-like protein
MAATVSDNTKMLEQMVQERTEELQRLAYRDQLTDIFNRRGFINAFADLQAKAGDDRLAMLLIDIDDFKGINDGFGHLAGDQVVAETAKRISDIIRPTDVCGRWGGDEFIVLINGLGTRGLRSIAEVIRKAVSGPALMLPDGREVTMTLSIGACLVEASDSIDHAVDMADAALYAAKSQGRDRVVVYDPVRNDVDQRRA